jgi:hypothetical protein
MDINENDRPHDGQATNLEPDGATVFWLDATAALLE